MIALGKTRPRSSTESDRSGGPGGGRARVLPDKLVLCESERPRTRSQTGARRRRSRRGEMGPISLHGIDHFSWRITRDVFVRDADVCETAMSLHYNPLTAASSRVLCSAQFLEDRCGGRLGRRSGEGYQSPGMGVFLVGMKALKICWWNVGRGLATWRKWRRFSFSFSLLQAG